MRGTAVAVVIGLLLALNPAQPSASAPAAVHTITYDKYSLIIDGQRQFVWSGEFHYWRLPSPDLWRDVLQKMKAAGFNAASIYFHWGYHSPAPGVYDFTGVRDVDRLLDIASEVGIFVIARPGPYIHAETSSGGFPAWLKLQSGVARSDAPDYLAAARDWFDRVDAIIAQHQYTTGGGTVLAYQIENEFYLDRPAYMQALIDQVRSDGITVPTIGNHKGLWATGQGATDLPGTEDFYPQGFDCSAAGWNQLPPLRRPAGAENKPLATWEYGSGSISYVGGPGFDQCRRLTNEQYESVYFKNIIGQGETATNFYMTYGGTSWGWLPWAPVSYTSYDYGAPIDESRQLGAKYDQMKRLGYLVQTVAPLAKTDAGSLASGPSNPAVTALVRRNPDTGTQAIVLRQAAVGSTANVTTTIGLPGYPRVPAQGDIRLNGRDSKLLLANYDIGASHLVYSTSELLTHVTTDRDVGVLYGRHGEGGETVLRFASQPTVAVQSGTATQIWDAARRDLRLNYAHANGAPVRLLISGGGLARPLQLILVSDADSAQFWRHGSVLSRGPYLVRTATAQGGAVAFTGDTAASGELEVWGASSVTWNGTAVATSETSAGSRIGSLGGPAGITLPSLSWRYQADTGEAQPSYDDSSWARALHGLTSDGYGFYHGNVWYRGHFTGSGGETSASVTGWPGLSGGYSVWLNGTYLGYGDGGSQGTSTTSFPFPAGLVRPGTDNVLAILIDNTGHNEITVGSDVESHKLPRGVTAVNIAGAAGTVDWRIQGSRGGENLIDRTRGPLNTGGLGGERAGWSLPGYPDGSWPSVTLPHRPGQPGVGWYRSTVSLNLPAGQDVPLAVAFDDAPDRRYRALLFVNGWQFGRYANNVGPQKVFPIPPGIVNPRGTNSIAVAVWSHDASTAGLGNVRLVAQGNYASSLTVAAVDSPAYDPAVYTRPDVTAPAGPAYVSDLSFVAVSNGWGPVERDRSVGESQPGDGRTLTLRGQTFGKGLGTHAASDIAVYTGGRCTSFAATVGVDDEADVAGSVVFTVLADGLEAARTGVLTRGGPAQVITANVTGARQVDLVVSDAGDGVAQDHADWADARLTCSGSVSQPPPRAPHTYFLANALSGKYVDVEGASGADEAPVVQWGATGGANQRWQVLDGGAGSSTLRSVNSGRCMDVYRNSLEDGGWIIQWGCTGTTNQRWRETPVGGGWWTIRSELSGKCLDVAGGSTADGVRIVQNTCSGAASQRWRFVLLS